MKVRVGFGYDVHALVPERDLWLGGVKIEHTMGLQGHSDADVLIHAICDALLGAANMRDIGYHFPDTAGEYKDIDSKILLFDTMELLRDAGYTCRTSEAESSYPRNETGDGRCPPGGCRRYLHQGDNNREVRLYRTAGRNSCVCNGTDTEIAFLFQFFLSNIFRCFPWVKIYFHARENLFSPA